MPKGYAELHCLSNFTFLRGASHAEELVARAAALGYAALAITDECSMAGVVRAHVAAKHTGLKLIIGAQFHITSPHPSPLHKVQSESLAPPDQTKDAAPSNLRLVLLAENRQGYGHLCELISKGRCAAEKGEYRLTHADLADGIAHCLALWLPDTQPDAAAARWLAQRFPDRLWIAVELLASGGDRLRLEQLRALGEKLHLPCVASGDVHMHVRERRCLQDTLTAIRIGTPVAKVGYGLHPSGERHLRSLKTLERIYPPELLEATLDIAARCDFSLDSLRYEYPEELVPPGLTPAQYLRQLTEEGLRWRFPPAAGGLRTEDSGLSKYKTTSQLLSPQHSVLSTQSSALGTRERADVPSENKTPQRRGAENAKGAEKCIKNRTSSEIDLLVHDIHDSYGIYDPRATSHESPAVVPDRVRRLVEHELALIAELGYEPYFLTVHDVVKYARGEGILCQGRGSAANSAVCYALGITEVDPARMEMLFERFISRERNEPPDIDVDFEHQRREEVIQYIYRNYGRHRAALAATVITYRPKSALRDVGKALGFDLEQVDRLAKTMAWWDGRKVNSERLREAGFDLDHPLIRRLIELVHTLIGFPRHLSQHVGGFVISRGPLSRLVPIENAAMQDRTVIQWDKDDLDALGLLKIDVLALGMLSAIRRALTLVSGIRGKRFTLADVPPEDPAVYEMVGHGDTVGVFQIESRAQMAMLPRVKPKHFYDLVIEVALVRPGPIQGGMVHPYLRRRQGIDPITYPSEAVKKVLERTLGVPIFQEQVMQLAVVAAGFSPGEADRLRRSMASWRRKGGLEQFEERLISGMRARGYTPEFAQQIFKQIQGFGEYGFPESHSASFALLVYVSAWFKRHEPAALTCALLNSQPMGFYAPSQLVQDARRHGVEVRPVDVLVSEWDCTLEKSVPSAQCPTESQPAMRLGLRMVNGLSEAGAQRLIEARARERFESAEALLLAARLSRKDMECLAAADALASMSGHRRNAAWTVRGVEVRPPVLAGAPIHETSVDLPAPSESENTVADYASLGLTLGRHPMALLRPEMKRLRMLSAEEIKSAPHGSLVRAAGIVTCRQRPGTATGILFVTLEDETGFINVVVWGRSVEPQRRALLGSQLMGVHGKVEREGEVTHLIAGKVIDYSGLLGSLVIQSRDFH